MPALPSGRLPFPLSSKVVQPLAYPDFRRKARPEPYSFATVSGLSMYFPFSADIGLDAVALSGSYEGGQRIVQVVWVLGGTMAGQPPKAADSRSYGVLC